MKDNVRNSIQRQLKPDDAVIQDLLHKVAQAEKEDGMPKLSKTLVASGWARQVRVFVCFCVLVAMMAVPFIAINRNIDDPKKPTLEGVPPDWQLSIVPSPGSSDTAAVLIEEPKIDEKSKTDEIPVTDPENGSMIDPTGGNPNEAPIETTPVVPDSTNTTAAEPPKTAVEPSPLPVEKTDIPSKSNVINAMGNTFGNLNYGNGGCISVQGDRVYYNYKGGLESSNLDGSNVFVLLDKESLGKDENGYFRRPSNINVVGERIYFTDAGLDVGNGIYSVKYDGTDFKKLTYDGRIGRVIVIGDWIYYLRKETIKKESNGINYESGMYFLYRMKTDGTGKMRLTGENDYVQFYWIDNGRIYFGTPHTHCETKRVLKEYGWSEYNEYYEVSVICSIKTDGSDRKELPFVGYHIEPHEEDRVQKDSYAVGSFIGIYSGRIYFNIGNYGIWSMKTDGTDYKQASSFSSMEAVSINVVGDRIYYRNPDDGNKLYVMNLNGSEKKKFSNDYDIYSLNVANGRIYYFVNARDEGGLTIYLYSIKLDGTDKQQLLSTIYS